MALTTGDRITMIRECATLLDKEEWPDIDLILGQHGFMTSDDWHGEGKRQYVIAITQHVGDDDLQKFHSYLTSESDNSSLGQSPFKSQRLRVFFSHLATQRDAVGETARGLTRYGIDAFVAHDDIEPSREWQDVIEAGLTDCDAMVVFLHSGFGDSKWCDQEVGWAMGRRRPLLPLSFDSNPYGFMGKYQAHKCDKLTPNAVSDAIATWLASTPSLHGRLSASFTQGFAYSGSWDFTRKISALMDRVQTFTNDDLNLIEHSASGNVDVRECHIGGIPGPHWVANFVAARRAPATADPRSASSTLPF